MALLFFGLGCNAAFDVRRSRFGVWSAGSRFALPFAPIAEPSVSHHLEAGFHFVPEGHAIVARRFIAGLATHRICVPEGRLKWDLGCYMAKRGKRDAFLTPEQVNRLGLFGGEEGESGTHSLRQSK